MNKSGEITLKRVRTNPTNMVCNLKITIFFFYFHKIKLIPESNALKSWESKWGFTKEVYPEMYDQGIRLKIEIISFQ